jgi:spore coat protein CotH
MKLNPLLRRCLGLAALLLADPAGRAAAAAAEPAYVTRVFGLAKLHRIEIVVPEASLVHFQDRNAGRVKGTISFDGTVLRDIGVRQQGGTFLPYVGINGKPSLSLKFNEFTTGQELFGLKKLILKNQAQDRSLVNEHLTYEVFLRAGYPAPLTSYAQVKLNGIDQGIYLLREPINQQFLVRHFGKDRSKGNLYEIVQDIDPVRFPERLDLKDEEEDKRSRDDVRSLAVAARSATPETFAQVIAPHLDLDRFITYFALETATSHADGYANNTNNTYLYHMPGDDRFVFLPQGADQSFWAAAQSKRIYAPGQLRTAGSLARQVLDVPELRKKFDAEFQRVGRAPVWDKAALLARVAQVERLLAMATPGPKVTADVAKFQRLRPLIEAFINNGGTTGGTANLP